MLDYKIKELKREINPKEQKIKELRLRTEQLDTELQKFNGLNASLGIIVDDFKAGQDEMQQLIQKNRTRIRRNDILIKRFKDDVYDTVQHIDKYDELLLKMADIKETHVKEKEIGSQETDPDIKKEYENQKTYLENSVASLKKKKNKDKAAHELENLKIMKENMHLIEQIKTLRDENTMLAKNSRSNDPNQSLMHSASRMTRSQMSASARSNQSYMESQQVQDNRA